MTEKRKKAAPGERVKLTPLRVANLKKPTRKTMIRDKGSPLRLKLLPSGAATYLTHYRCGGKLRWFTIGPATGDFKVDLATARKKASWVRRVAADGGDPHGDKMRGRATVRAPKGTTFADLAEEYVEGHAKLKNRSWRRADRLIRSRVLAKLGSREIETIKKPDVKAIHAGITAEGHRTLADLVLANVSAVFAWAVEEERLADNPARGIRRNGTLPRERSLTDAEIRAVWPALLGPVGDMLKLVLISGQRPGEVRHMRREDLDGDHWTLHGAPTGAWPGTKNSRTHGVTLPRMAFDVIDVVEVIDATDVVDATDNLPHPAGGFVFEGRRPGRPAAPPHTRDLPWGEMDVAPFRAHDLRRTCASGLASLGTEPTLIDRILNHAPVGVTARVYDRHTYRDEIAAALATWAQHLTTVVNG